MADKKKRAIWCVYMNRIDADQAAHERRRSGASVRVYPRTVRAEGLSVLAFVVVTDAE